MDKIWLREGLDLKMVTFSCVPTGYRHGMVELVTNAKTLREIQVIKLFFSQIKRSSFRFELFFKGNKSWCGWKFSRFNHYRMAEKAQYLPNRVQYCSN